MRIFFFSRSMPCHSIGGMELIAWDVATGLAGKGHRVRIVTTAIAGGGDCDVPPSLADRLDVICLPGTAPGRYSFAWWRRSRRYFLEDRDEFRPDAVFSVSVGAGAVHSVLDGIPSLMQVHGTAIGDFQSKIRSGIPVAILKSPYNLLCVPRDLGFYRNVTKAVAVGPAVRSALGHPLIRSVLPESKVSLVPNGIDTDLFSVRTAARSRTRAAYGIPENAKVVISVSRLNVQKGVHIGLEAFSLIDRDDVWFIVVGDGPESEKLRQLAGRTGVAGRVVFTGGVKQHDIPDLYSAADLFLFSTTHVVEGLPLNLLEAMSMDLPSVISGHLVGSIEGLRGLDGVFPVDPGDIKNVAAGIASALAGSGTGRRAFVEEYYSKTKMVDSYERLLLEMSGRRS